MEKITTLDLDSGEIVPSEHALDPTLEKLNDGELIDRVAKIYSRIREIENFPSDESAQEIKNLQEVIAKIDTIISSRESA